MNVIDFKKYLDTLPPQTEVFVLRTRDHGYQGISTYFEPLEIDVNTEFTDMRKNPFARGKKYQDAVDLYLGED